jgi:excisionase family DNA binding protein
VSVTAPVPRSREQERLLTPAEVAAIFRVDPKTVTRWAAAKPPKIPSTRTPGGHRRFRESDVNRLLADQEQGTPQKLSGKPVEISCWLAREDGTV